MPILSLLLPTNLIFTCPNSEEYEQVKNDFIRDNLDYREGMSDDCKWSNLIYVFSNGLSARDRDLFESFKVTRQQVPLDNSHVLQLHNALNYFEHFYFFYHNDNPQYLLSDLEKQRLLTEVMEGMIPGKCEPGIITHFENTLQKARKDTNWVLNELSKQRIILIQQIADEYNAQYRVTESFSIHTVMHMSRLGKQKGFGIEPTNEIDDCYLSDGSKRQMTSYFDRVADLKFADYEQSVIPNLTEHAMLEMTEWLRSNGVDLTAWQANEITLSEKQVTDLNRFIPSLFDNQTIQGLGDYNDNGDTFSLFNKTLFYRNIQRRVCDKLIEDGVFLDLAADNSDKARFANVRWPKDAKKLFEAIYQIDARSVIDYANILNQHQNILLKYPTLILESLIKNRLLWLHFPKAIRNNVDCIDKLVSHLGNLLSESKSENEDVLIDVLWTLTKANTEYLKKLVPEVLSKKSIALKLVAKDGLLLEWMSDELRADPEVQRAAANQNSMAKMYAINDDLSDPLFFQYRDVHTQLAAFDLVPDDRFPCAIDRGQLRLAYLEKLKKMQNMLALLKQPFISTWHLIRLAQWLTPEELYQVNQARLNHGLSSLPHCNGDLLMQFWQDVGQKDVWSNNGYLSTKRQITASEQNLNSAAFLSLDYRKLIAKQAIFESNQWVLAFIAYQKQLPAYHVAFGSVDDLMSQLKINAKAFHVFLASIWRLLRDFLQKVLFPWMFFGAFCLLSYRLFLLAVIVRSVLVINLGIMFPFAIVLLVGLVAGYFWNYYGRYNTMKSIVAALLIALYFVINPLELIIIALFIIALFILVVTTVFFMAALGTVLFNNQEHWLGNPGDFPENWLGKPEDFDGLNLYTQGCAFLSSMRAVITEWPPLFVASIVPWITRSFAAIVSQNVTPTGDKALKINIEDNIFRLLHSDELSAVKKGELLEVLWDKVQADVDPLFGHEPGFRKSLDKQYTVLVFGEECQLSFLDVAATPRVDATQFIPKAPDARFSFFGLRGMTTTTSQLPHAQMTPLS